MPDVFIFTETWYDGFTPTHIPGYVDYHSVRNGRSGGVSLFIKNQIHSSKIENHSYTNEFIEICTAKISYNDRNMYICGVYRPHSGSIDNFTAALELNLCNDIFNNAHCIFAGDFNANLRSSDGEVDRLVHMMQSHHYIQTINDFTRPETTWSAASLIDHFWTNQIGSHNGGVIKTSITDHHTFFYSFHFLLINPTLQKSK